MAVLCLAIVGKNNEPLYLCDCDFEKQQKDDESLDGVEDVFGFSEESSKGVENNLSLQKEVRCEENSKVSFDSERTYIASLYFRAVLDFPPSIVDLCLRLPPVFFSHSPISR